MKITIKTIPHEEQRYETVGDWYFGRDNDITITVSELGDWRKNSLVAVHELIEALLCKDRGITDNEVTDFDKEFELNRGQGEPGDDSKSPYKKEHCFATGIERLLCSELDIDWKEYDEHISKISSDM